MTHTWNLSREEISSEGFAISSLPQEFVIYPEQLQQLLDQNSLEEHSRTLKDTLKRRVKQEFQSQIAGIDWIVQHLDNIITL